MTKIDWNPSPRKLRQFGWISLFGFGVFGLVTAWRIGAISGGGSWRWPMMLWGLAVVLPLVGAIAPRALKPVYLLMFVLAFPIGWIIGNVLLSVLFLFVFTPLAMIFKLSGRDELSLRKENAPDSFWTKPVGPIKPERYYRQF